MQALTGCGEFPELKHSTLEGCKKTDSQEVPQISDSQGHTLPKVTQTLRTTKKSESDIWSCLAVLQRAPELQLSWGPLTLGVRFQWCSCLGVSIGCLLVFIHTQVNKPTNSLAHCVGYFRQLNWRAVWEKKKPNQEHASTGLPLDKSVGELSLFIIDMRRSTPLDWCHPGQVALAIYKHGLSKPWKASQ